MLQEVNGTIQELTTTTNTAALYQATGGLTSNSIWVSPPTYQTYWGGYPVYTTTDKTAKAIAILKALQADKQIECKSVPKFIELVEKIAGLL